MPEVPMMSKIEIYQHMIDLARRDLDQGRAQHNQGRTEDAKSTYGQARRSALAAIVHTGKKDVWNRAIAYQVKAEIERAQESL